MTLIEKNSLSKYILHELKKCDLDTTIILKNLSLFINYCVLSINEYYIYLNRFKKYEKMHRLIQENINTWMNCPEIAYEKHGFAKSCQKYLMMFHQINTISKDLKKNFTNIYAHNIHLKMKELADNKYFDFYFNVLDEYLEDFRLLFFIKNIDTLNFYKNKMHQKMKFFNLFMSITLKMQTISLNNK